MKKLLPDNFSSHAGSHEAWRKQTIHKSIRRHIGYKNNTATIELQKNSKKISLKKSVRKGNTVSLKLFTACLEEVSKALDWDNREI